MTSIQFYELAFVQGSLIIINRDTATYSNTNLTDGSLVTFTSISNQLDEASPFKDQIEYVPSRVHMVLKGEDAGGLTLLNLALWSYGGEGHCYSEPLSDGDTIGWIELVSIYRSLI